LAVKNTVLSLPPVQKNGNSSLKFVINCEANVNKTSTKSLWLTFKPLPLPSAFKKWGKFFTKQVDFQTKKFWFFWKINEEKFGRNIQALTFALPLKKWVAGKAKRSLKVWKQ